MYGRPIVEYLDRPGVLISSAPLPGPVRRPQLDPVGD
jgi:hypothetical protein